MEDWQRLARYYAGEASPEDEAEIRRWMESDPERLRMVTSMREVWTVSAALPPDHSGDADRVWSQVRSRKRAGAAGSPRPAAERAPRRSATAKKTGGALPIVRIAAAVLLVLTPLLWMLASDLLDRGSASTAQREITTERGERLRLTLGDGSLIELGPASTLHIPTSFAGDRRQVRLEGIARFDVEHDARRPFTVRTGNAVTRVLGTEFVVRAYAREDETRVAVVEGSVELRSSAGSEATGVAVAPGQIGRLTTGDAVRLSEDDEAFNTFLAWTAGRLEFSNEPLERVLLELEYWYDRELQVADPHLATQPLSMVVEGDSLSQVLHLIGLVLDARYEEAGDTITLRSNTR